MVNLPGSPRWGRDPTGLPYAPPSIVIPKSVVANINECMPRMTADQFVELLTTCIAIIRGSGFAACGYNDTTVMGADGVLYRLQQPQQQGHSSTTEVRGRVHAFAEEKLYVSKGSRILTRTLYDAFKAFMGGDVDFLTFSIEEFGSELYRCLKSKGGEFSTLEKKNGSVDGSKGRFWKNLCVRV